MEQDWSHKLTISKDGCWLWKGNINPDGYGRICYKLGYRKYVTEQAHKFFYEKKYGKVPKGSVFHHSCENRHCCNPDHVIHTTAAEHRRMHADTPNFPCGHPRTPENTRKNRPGQQCLECHRTYMRGYHRTNGAHENLTLVLRSTLDG